MGHHLVLIQQVSDILLKGLETVLLKAFLSFVVWTMVVEIAVSHVPPKSPIGSPQPIVNVIVLPI